MTSSTNITQYCTVLSWYMRKRIDHWCSVVPEKSQPSGPTFQWETRQASFPTGTLGPRVGIFLSPLYTNDGFYLSYMTMWQLSYMGRVNYSFFTKNDIQRNNILRPSYSKTPSKGKRYLLTSYNVNDITEHAPRDVNGNVTLMAQVAKKDLFCN